MRIIQGDAKTELQKLKTESINCCVTSPPYWTLRDYGVEGQLGLEPTFQEYIFKLCNIYDEVKRVLRKDGTCWVVLGDTYGTISGAMRDGKFGSKNTNNQQFIQPKSIHKCLLQIPARFSIEMCNRGWILRNTIIWYKPNCMPSSVKDRFTVDFEYIFFFVKDKKYWFKTQYDLANYDGRKQEVMRGSTKYSDKELVPGNTKHTFAARAHIRWQKDKDGKRVKNKRCVWKINTKPFKEAHFAVFPEKLIETPIKAGCPKGGVVLDPFSGSGTTGVVAQKLGRDFIGIELNPEYIKIAEKRLEKERRLF